MTEKTKLLSIGRELVENINYLQKTEEMTKVEGDMLANGYLLAVYSGEVQRFQNISQMILAKKSSETAKNTLALIMGQR